MYSAYINRIGKFLPGEPLNNYEMEEYLGKMASRPSRVSQRILNSNGIQKRYYAIDKQQQTLYYNSQMAAFAVRAAISKGESGTRGDRLTGLRHYFTRLISIGIYQHSTGGTFRIISPKNSVNSRRWLCRVSALNYAPSQLEPCQKQTAIAVAAEFPSRLFKNTLFEA
jgi:3-oxoacyl-[acyl-carrier-protein] synthase-3